jgi:predicted dinucleotide-utilizing enzyme
MNGGRINMTTIEDDTKEHEFTIICDKFNENYRELLKSLRKEKIDKRIESAIEFLEAQGYKVIKN